MASKMGCKSCGEFAMQHFRDGRLLLDEFSHSILRLRSGAFSLDTLVHAEQFLCLVRQHNSSSRSSRKLSRRVQTEDMAKHPTSAVDQTRKRSAVVSMSTKRWRVSWCCRKQGGGRRAIPAPSGREAIHSADACFEACCGLKPDIASRPRSAHKPTL
jgi:hypothetical protein